MTTIEIRDTIQNWRIEEDYTPNQFNRLLTVIENLNDEIGRLQRRLDELERPLTETDMKRATDRVLKPTDL